MKGEKRYNFVVVWEQQNCVRSIKHRRLLTVVKNNPRNSVAKSRSSILKFKTLQIAQSLSLKNMSTPLVASSHQLIQLLTRIQQQSKKPVPQICNQAGDNYQPTHREIYYLHCHKALINRRKTLRRFQAHIQVAFSSPRHGKAEKYGVA
mmetsp:Transcript_7536/g.9076  ORF Transcript_7536/g.9076 Transcript_7536/m.9076 type:complete len:149 (+) Transcript_7536:295-741(+)